MNAWFAPRYAALASFAALVSLLSLLEPYALHGKHRLVVLLTCGAVFLAGVSILATAGYAREVHQPSHVLLALSLAGGLIVIFSALGFGRLLYLYRRRGRTSAGAPPAPDTDRRGTERWPST